MSTPNDHPIDHTDLFIGGAFVPAQATGRCTAVNPATEEVVGSVPDAGAGDVDRAVTAARAALTGWGRTAAVERSAVLDAVADGFAARSAELAETIARQNGAPHWWVQQDV